MSATVKVLNLVEACGVGTGGPSPALVEACGVETSGPSPALEVSQLLQAAMLRLTNTFLDDVKGTVDYVALRHSQEYREYRTLATRLQEVDVSTLDDSEKKAFFINVYNALTMESVSQLEELPASTLEVDHFWTSSAYLIGPHSFTLDQIEHGILRGNKSHPSTGSPVLPAGDPRLQYSVRHLDPRVHFALNCGAKVDPGVRGGRRASCHQCSPDGGTRNTALRPVLLRLVPQHRLNTGHYSRSGVHSLAQC
ncbi:uncharacterized protein [Procambarus clarkii]|uniref:uncharacterized protein isoform X2 n=1 Tax=Procambarus clarkii TaxID=6728 RepID=UPI001E674828|nr:uncharacterized protein LOC123764432 isoform X3 [Procambarus clarkii]